MENITVNTNDAGQRLDKFITKRYRSMPMPLLYKYIRTKRIKVNGKRAKENQMLAEGDAIELYIPVEFTGGDGRDDAFLHLAPRLNVAYEDENILIADKKSGMIVHPDEGSEGDTLIDHIKAYLYRKGEYDPARENSFAPALCNRIDRNTEGLVAAAKNAAALREMNELIRCRSIEKVYLAVCHGFFDKKQGEMTAFLEKDCAGNKVYIKRAPSANTKTAMLGYRVISENSPLKLSLLEIVLMTGRTHQIRAQMADSGHPLLGDGKYAVNRDDRKLGYSSQALCAYSLTFHCRDGVLAYLDGKTVTAAVRKRHSEQLALSRAGL